MITRNMTARNLRQREAEHSSLDPFRCHRPNNDGEKGRSQQPLCRLRRASG